jgi:hypothetical protein
MNEIKIVEDGLKMTINELCSEVRNSRDDITGKSEMIKVNSNNMNEAMSAIWNGSVTWLGTSDVVHNRELLRQSSFGCTDTLI